MERKICVARLSGRCADGVQRDRGFRYHIVPGGGMWDRALCGAKAGRLSGCGFVFEDREPTCPRCLKRDEKRKSAFEAMPRVECSVAGHYFKVQEDGENEGRFFCVRCGVEEK